MTEDFEHIRQEILLKDKIERELMEEPLSFSRAKMFWDCPRSWYLKYILKAPQIEEHIAYAHRGNVVHKVLEKYYNNEITDKDALKEEFNRLWEYYELQYSFLRNQKDETWLMIINGKKLNLDLTSIELEIFLGDAVAHLDAVNTNRGLIGDFKTSTRSEERDKEYAMQLKYYAYLYFRRFNELPNVLRAYYLKYNGDKSLLEIRPTINDIRSAEKWHQKTIQLMEYYMRNPDKLPDFNREFFFCPFKYMWDCEEQDVRNIMNVVLKISGNYVYVKSSIDDFLNRHIHKKFSYEKQDTYYIKRQKPNANTMVHFWHPTIKRMPLGFFSGLHKTLKDYATYNKKTLALGVEDTRYFNETKLDMPERLLSDKQLHSYQREAVDTYLNNAERFSMLEITTGGGKTLIATELIRMLAMKTLFIVDKKELMYQAKDTIEENLGIEVGVIGDGQSDIRDVTVATVQTLHKHIKEYKHYLNSVRFVIFDECHKVSANSYYRLGIYLRNSEYRLGITGTAYRDDGEDMKITAMTGYTCMSITGQRLIKEGYLVMPRLYFVDYELAKNEKKQLEERAMEGLINETPQYAHFYNSFIVDNEKRNTLIKDMAEIHAHEKVLILVKMIAHGEYLESIIPNSRYVYGKTKAKTRNELIESFKNEDLNILISTISIFAEGIDIPELNVIINAAANKGDVKTIQVLGRVLRKGSGEKNALYYDFNDYGSFMKAAAYSRMKAFMNEGYFVNKCKRSELIENDSGVKNDG